MKLRRSLTRALLFASRKKLLFFLPDRTYLKMIYYLKFDKKLDLTDPKTFNEKLQWLKLNFRKPEFTQMVDKYRVRDYIEQTIGKEYLIPLLDQWDDPGRIDFDSLPDRFVLKCNHDSGGIVICTDKKSLNTEQAIRKIKRSFRTNGYWFGREWPYKNVKPCVIAEQYMEDYDGKGELTDYKLHFFNGECKAIMVGQNRYGKAGLEKDYYSPEWEHYPFTRGHSANAEKPSEKPAELEEMIRLGKKLAGDIPFVRIDFYVIRQRIYFGEITFFPASGFGPFNPPEWDTVFGDWIRLPAPVK